MVGWLAGESRPRLSGLPLAAAHHRIRPPPAVARLDGAVISLPGGGLGLARSAIAYLPRAVGWQAGFHTILSLPRARELP